MKKLIKNSIMLALALCFVCAFSGCIFTLETPTITIDGYALKWNSQGSVSKYEIVLNEDSIYTTDSSLDIAKYIEDGGTYTAKVKAYSKSLFYNDSEFSEEFSFVVPETKLNKPTNLTLDTSNHKYIISWNSVSHASFYIIKLYNQTTHDITYQTTTHTNCDFTSSITKGGEYTVTIRAYAENLETYAPSIYSDGIDFESVGYLDTPSATISGTTLSWASVPGASSYVVATTEGKTYTTTATSVNLSTTSLLSSNNITPLFVQAISNNTYNYDSAYSDGVVYYDSTAKSSISAVELEYMNNSFDLCADNTAELQNIVFYAMYYRLTNLKFCSTYLSNSAVNEAVRTQLANYNEIMSISYGTPINGEGVVTLNLTFAHPNTPTLVATGSVAVTQKNNIQPIHYTDTPRDDDFEDFLINNRTKSLVVFNSDQLYVALQNGYKPVFTSTNSPARSVYERGKEVLRQIIDDSMTELQKLNAIYDWLSYTVKYDYNLLNLTEQLESANPNTAQATLSKYDGFYIEGVMFDDGQAVCDGISKTFVMLASIENITTYKVSGTANGGNHAWNKVALDLVGEDDIKEWYTIDVTWGDMTQKDGNNYTEYLARTYYLVTDAMISNNSHYETNPNTDTSETMFNYYANTVVTDGVLSTNLYIESASQLATLKAIMQNTGISGLDIEISPSINNFDRMSINNYLSSNFNTKGENIKSSYNTTRTIYVIWL